MYNIGFYAGKFLPFHNGHLNCIYRAAAQCKKLYVVMMYNGQEELDIINNQDIKFDKKLLTPRVREMVIQRTIRDLPNVEFIAYNAQPADERAIAEGKHEWYYECQDMVALMGKFDAAYSSELRYSELFKKFYPWTTPICLDIDRKQFNISGSELRTKTPIEAYYNLPRAYQRLINKSVLIVGTESCGKSVLTKKLAKIYNTSYTEEYGRLICEKYNASSLDVEFYEEFLFGQKALEIEARNSANRLYFCDSDSTITNFYARLYENQNLPLADAISKYCNYDLILFVEPTNEWVADGFRTHGKPEQRARSSTIMKDMFIKEYGKQIHILNGTYEENYLEAIKLINKMLEG